MSENTRTDSQLTQIQREIRNARRVSTPIIAVATSDQEATLAQICELASENSPVISYDAIRGLVGRNNLGIESVRNLTGGEHQSANARIIQWTLMTCREGGSLRTLTTRIYSTGRLN